MAGIRKGSPEFVAERKKRLRQLEIVREQFPTSLDFVTMVLSTFGYIITPMQIDMVMYMQDQDNHFMVQMPRGEGKTLITSILAVYELILDPSCRVAIFSGNDDVASEISKFVFDIFHDLEILHFMLPD